MKIAIDQRGPQNAYEDRKAYRNLLQAFAYPGKMMTLRADSSLIRCPRNARG